MFLWVSMMLILMKRMDSDVDFEAILDEVSDSLADLYQWGLERLERDLVWRERAWIKEIIMWIVVTKYDLHLTELEALIVSSHKFRDGTPSTKLCYVVN